jgi:hypothetical protein
MLTLLSKHQSSNGCVYICGRESPAGMQDSINNYGFIYSEEVSSPDGAVKVIYGYNDGEKSPTTIEPRVIDASTGEVLVDLWRAWCQGTVEFVEPGRLRIRVHDAYHQVLICEAEIDLNKRVFAMATSPGQYEALYTFRQKIVELHPANAKRHS